MAAAEEELGDEKVVRRHGLSGRAGGVTRGVGRLQSNICAPYSHVLSQGDHVKAHVSVRGPTSVRVKVYVPHEKPREEETGAGTGVRCGKEYERPRLESAAMGTCHHVGRVRSSRRPAC